MEIAKLIQKVNDTTNNLFEHSDQFKFKLKSEQPSANKKPSGNNTSKKNIKINDPFKKADHKMQLSRMTT